MKDNNLVVGIVFFIVILVIGLFVVGFNTDYFEGKQGTVGSYRRVHSKHQQRRCTFEKR